VHGWILAALSPYLSQKVSASPCPPAGQQRRVKLQVVNAQTLLKLVGLLYSGSLEGNENTDQADVLAAANQLGFDRLVEGWGDACNVEVQVGTKGKRDVETQVEGTGFVEAATQTIGGQSDVCLSQSPQNTPLAEVLVTVPTTARLDEIRLSNVIQFDRILETKDVAAAPILSTITTITSAPRNNRVSSGLSNKRPKRQSLQKNNRGKTCTREKARWQKRSPTRMTAMGFVKTRELSIKVTVSLALNEMNDGAICI